MWHLWLKGSDTNYPLSLSCFFVTYVVLSIPETLLAKAEQSSTSIDAGALNRSIAATCQAAALNSAGLYVSRSSLELWKVSDSSDTFIDTSLNRYPLRAYFTYWYLPTEVAKRVGLDISAGSLSGA